MVYRIALLPALPKKIFFEYLGIERVSSFWFLVFSCEWREIVGGRGGTDLFCVMCFCCWLVAGLDEEE